MIEAGFVKSKEVINFFYNFQVYKTEEISFRIHLNIFSGDSDLYMKKCSSFDDCQFSTSNLEEENKEIIKVQNQHTVKEIQHRFTCEAKNGYAVTNCLYVIGILGKENHGTHFDISLTENDLQKQLTPGYNANINMIAGEKQHFKFSYPANYNRGDKLFFEVDSVWGNFKVFLDKERENPDEKNNILQETFESSKSGLYNAFKSYDIQNYLKR
jgi:hypothetical protein